MIALLVMIARDYLWKQDPIMYVSKMGHLWKHSSSIPTSISEFPLNLLLLSNVT